jgi:hypothetical protein
MSQQQGNLLGAKCKDLGRETLLMGALPVDPQVA